MCVCIYNTNYAQNRSDNLPCEPPDSDDHRQLRCGLASNVNISNNIKHVKYAARSTHFLLFAVSPVNTKTQNNLTNRKN